MKRLCLFRKTGVGEVYNIGRHETNKTPMQQPQTASTCKRTMRRTSDIRIAKAIGLQQCSSRKGVLLAHLNTNTTRNPARVRLARKQPKIIIVNKFHVKHSGLRSCFTWNQKRALKQEKTHCLVGFYTKIRRENQPILLWKIILPPFTQNFS